MIRRLALPLVLAFVCLAPLLSLSRVPARAAQFDSATETSRALRMKLFDSLRASVSLGPSATPASNAVCSVASAPMSLQATPAYSFTGATVVTPTIDGVFTGQFVDGNGTTPGVGTQDSLAFVAQKPFDAADNVYWFDPASFFRSWQPATMTLWLDGDDNGVYQTAPFTDAVIAGTTPTSGTTGSELNGLAGFPTGLSPLGFSPFVFNDVEFIYSAPSKANNRYDNGEDIYYVGQYAAPPVSVDSVAEFRGGLQLLVPDPEDPLGPAIAHVYIEQDADYLYFHNDFLVDAESAFYNFDGMAGTDGFIDGDGIASSDSGAPDRIGIDPAARKWFTTTDQVAWHDADGNAHWTPGLDALWLDDGNSVYTGTDDSLIVYASGVLTDGLPASVLLNPATFEFVYRDDNADNTWDSGEDIRSISGDETWDYNYFDNRIAWLIDGDGAQTADRGSDDLTRVDGDQWFDAEDRVYWFDANGDTEWTEATDALWRDNNLNGTYQSGTDTVIRSTIGISQNTTTNMLLLQRLFVDGNGTTSGAGSDDTARTGQTPFAPDDRVFWHDGDRSQDWTISDTLWLDDGDGVFGTSITDTVIVSATGFTSGISGSLLTPAAHWIGYDDGEVDFNGRYDSGEDIAASNSYFAYDDFEVNPNFQYDPGEDVYDRDYLEIWVYAEGNSADTDMGGNEFAPDQEPALRDIGFRVHLNGVRIDAAPALTTTRTISDYDAPHGIQAAAGWGPSRGFIGFTPAGTDPAFGGFNRHYEYRIPRQDGAIGALSLGVQPASVQREREHREVIAILPDCHVLVKITWKDIKRRNSQGMFVSGSGKEYPTADGAALVWEFFVHPLPPPPPPPPPIKNDLNDPYWPDGTSVPTPPTQPRPHPASSFFDVFYPNTIETEIVQLSLTGSSPLGNQTRIIGWQTSHPETQFNPGFGTSLGMVFNLPPGGWIELIGETTVSNLSLVPGAIVTNVVNVTGTTPGGPLPPTAPGSDSVTFNPPMTITLIKKAVTNTVAAGGRVTYTILYENPGPFALSNLRLTDTLPMSITPQSAWPVDSFFDVFYQVDLPPLPPRDRGRVQIVGVVSPSVPVSTVLTNTVRISFDSQLTGTLFKEAAYAVTVKGNPHYIYLPVVLK